MKVTRSRESKSNKNVTDLICCSLPVAVSQSLIALSSEPEASCLPLSKNVTDMMCLRWPSRICSRIFQAFYILNSFFNYVNIHLLNLLLQMYVFDAKTVIEEYSCNDVMFSIV